MKLLRRIWDALMREPMQHVSIGDLPDGFEDAIVTVNTISFGWRARVGILIGCQVEVRDITYCEHAPGKLQTKTGLWVFNPTQPPSGNLGIVESSSSPPPIENPDFEYSKDAFICYIRYTCPDCGATMAKREAEGVTRRQIDCPHCEFEGTVDGKDAGVPLTVAPTTNAAWNEPVEFPPPPDISKMKVSY